MEQIIEEQTVEEQIVEKKKLLVEYLLLGFVILWSGGFFTYGLFPNWQYVLFVVSLFIMVKRGLNLETKYIIVISTFALIAVTHSFIYHGPITSIIKPTFRFLAIAMVAVIVRPNLNHVFIKITTFFAFFSLVFWLVDLSPTGHTFLLNVAKGLPQFGADTLTDSNFDRYGYVNYTLYFYTVSTGDVFLGFMYRNCGPFFEPGRFAIPLTISLAMILFTNNYQKYKMPFFLILIANLTTFSTTGYLVMITLFIGYYMGQSNTSSIRNLTMLLLVLVGTYYLMGVDFMGEKINLALDDTDIANSRFGAMYYHFPQILQSPWIGYGVFLGKVFGDLEMSPCGITDMMRIWGVPMFVVCVILLYQGTRSYLIDKKIYRIAFVTILLYNAYTQTIMNEPLYYLLYFIGSKDEVYDDKEIDDEEIDDDEDFIDNEVDYYEIDINTEEVYAANI